MSVRFMFRRSHFRLSLLSFLCLLSLGVGGYLWVQSPFATARLKRALVAGTPRNMMGEYLAADPAAIRACEELIADPHWHERLPRPSKEIIIDVLSIARSEALAPALRDFLAAWNRLPLEKQEEEAGLATSALIMLRDLPLPSGPKALADLTREFPPFPRPYAPALEHYARGGQQREVLALATAALENARRIPDVTTPEGAASRAVLQDIRDGLAPLVDLPEVRTRLWEILNIQLRDGDRPVDLPNRKNEDLTEFTRELFRHVPELPAINQSQATMLRSLPGIYSPRAEAITDAFDLLMTQAGNDVRKIHWLKKLVIIKALGSSGPRCVTGPRSVLPLLEVLSQDQSAVHTLEKNTRSGPSEEIEQDASLPIPPEWKLVRTYSISDLAKSARSRLETVVRHAPKTAR